MKQDKLDDLFLDVVNVVKNCDTDNGESVFFMCLKDGNAKYSFCGNDVDLINSFITCMNEVEGFYDILSSAVELFYEDAICVIDEN